MDIRLHPQKRSALIIQSSFLSLLRQPFLEGNPLAALYRAVFFSDRSADVGRCMPLTILSECIAKLY